MSVNSSICFGWYLHPSWAHITVSTPSGICKTVTATYRELVPVQSRSRQFAVTVLQMPDGVDTVTWAPDNGWRYNPKHVEQFADINKLYIVASCWTIIDIYSWWRDHWTWNSSYDTCYWIQWFYWSVGTGFLHITRVIGWISWFKGFECSGNYTYHLIYHKICNIAHGVCLGGWYDSYNKQWNITESITIDKYRRLFSTCVRLLKDFRTDIWFIW
jgi:hypothetical protein